MGPYADTVLWVALSIGLLLVATASLITWRVRTGPHPLDYPSDKAYYEYKAREAEAAAGARDAGQPA